jgi:DNA polymerase-1
MYLVDAHSLIFQVFHAIRGMSSPTGLPTNAVFGFVRDLLFLRNLQPDYLLCAFDLAEPTFRSAIYPDYKAHREPPPDDLQLQIPLIKQAVEALAIPALSAVGYEADDVMATIARAASARGLTVYLCTSDKDCRQLIDDRIRLYSLRKREEFGRAELLADWGITPEQVVDLQALVGDSVDNVPGVPGIGVKTAAKLLQDFATLDNLLDNLDKVPGKKQQSLRESGDAIALSRKLVRLDDHVPLGFDWEGWKVRPIDAPRMLELCKEWGFTSLPGQIRALARAQEPAAVGTAVAAAPVQAELFSPTDEELFPFGANAPVGPASRAGPEDSAARLAAPTGEQGDGEAPAPAATGQKWRANYRLIDTPAGFKDLLRQLRKQKRFAIDLETTSLEPIDAELVGVALNWQDGEAFYVPVRGPEGERHLGAEQVLAELKPILEDPRIAKVNQNIKYDLMVLRSLGVEMRGIAGDPMVADYLLHAGERSHNLEDLARRYLDHQVIPITDLIGKKTRKQPQLRMDQVSTERVAQYAGEDADVAWRLTHLLEGQLDSDEQLRKLYDDLEVPLIEVLAEMELNGIRLDVPYLQQVGEEMGRTLQSIEKEIYELAGHEFNIGSLPQLRKVLFEELKLPVQKKTGVTGAASTDQESLEKLAALKHPGAALPRKILEHRQVAKLKSTYVDALPGLVKARTGRAHTSFNQTVTATGRLSSTAPNLQNIPVRREMGQQIRRAFVPEPGWLLLTADYSQIELRLLAHFSADEQMCKAFAEDRDIHGTVAAQIFGVPESEVTPEQRRMAKTVNFGVIYGISAQGLATRLGLTKEQGAAFIKSYFARYPRVEAYQANLLKECRRTGIVKTILGRRRTFDRTAIRDNSRPQDRNTAEREAINMEVQGSAADLIKLAMLNVLRKLKEDGYRARLLLQIHDELVLEAPPDELPRLAEMVRREMTEPVRAALSLRVPLRVDLSAGPNWLDVESIAD